jgi:hypothetical protein
MTERLSAAGKNLLERGRRLRLPPPLPSLPRAYTHLLLDPADLLGAACGAMLNASPVVHAEAADQRVEQRAAARFQPTVFRTRASTPAGANAPRAPATRDGGATGQAPATAHTARRAWPLRPPAPVGPHADAAARAATPEPSPATNSPLRSTPSPAEAVNVPAQDIRAATLPEAFARRRSDPSTDTTIRPPVSVPSPSETSPAVNEPTVIVNPLPGLGTAATVRPGPSRADARPQGHADATGPSNDGRIRVPSSPTSTADATSPGGEGAPSSVLNFAQTPSRLAAVLNANLSPPAQVPGGFDETEAARSTSPARAERARVAREPADAPQAADEAARAHAGLSVEELIEEFYERLRLDFLRTYGTSGE